MNLVIDIGNTKTKIAVFEEEKIRYHLSLDKLTKDFLTQLSSRYSLSKIILSTVKKPDAKIEDLLKSYGNYLLMHPDLPMPIKHQYASIQTLGMDRILAVIGANSLYPCTNLLVVDIGTCMTFDLLEKEGVYLGGAISPGIALRYKAVHNFTDKLPLIERSNLTINEIPIMANNTVDCIKSGVIHGMRYEIKGFIEHYMSIYDNLHIFFTGGDACFFETMLKKKIFANQNLVLLGLNQMLLYNARQ